MNALTRTKTLLLDTNLLLLLFIGGKDPSLIPKAKTLSAFNEDDYDLLAEIVNTPCATFFESLISLGFRHTDSLKIS